MAIFKRRRPRKTHQKLREYLWPSQGWHRTLLYYKHRVFRGGDSTYRITGGLATGAAVSFTPFIGTHFIQAVFFGWLFRQNLLAALLGTAWGNPWTFPFLFWASHSVGVMIINLMGFGDFVALPDGESLGTLVRTPGDFLSYLFTHPVNILLPFATGGYFVALGFWPLAYALLYFPVRMLRQTYHKQRLLRVYSRRYREKKKRDAEQDSRLKEKAQ